MGFLEGLVAAAYSAFFHVRNYVIVTTLYAASVVLVIAAAIGAFAFFGYFTPHHAGTLISENLGLMILAGISMGLFHAHETGKSRSTLAFLILMLILGVILVNTTKAGELTEPVPAGDLKVTPRGLGEDLQQALERARKQLPENALAVGVECIPEPDGLINCSYLYRLPKGDQIAPVSCRDFSPYNLCMWGNACYGEGAIIAQNGRKTICQREGRAIFEAQTEYKRLSWAPLTDEK
jgi:hypothetical protein